MKTSPFKITKQKLSKEAALKKKKRDKASAMTAKRKKHKREAQVERRKKPSTFLKGKDYDHKDGAFKSVKANRGNDGQGTKKEGNKKY
tara:strand:- start:45 stop:308 length:264 start_codon:yes stop_codon:yes gene_type:complete